MVNWEAVNEAETDGLMFKIFVDLEILQMCPTGPCICLWHVGGIPVVVLPVAQSPAYY